MPHQSGRFLSSPHQFSSKFGILTIRVPWPPPYLISSMSILISFGYMEAISCHFYANETRPDSYANKQLGDELLLGNSDQSFSQGVLRSVCERVRRNGTECRSGAESLSEIGCSQIKRHGVSP